MPEHRILGDARAPLALPHISVPGLRVEGPDLGLFSLRLGKTTSRLKAGAARQPCGV